MGHRIPYLGSRRQLGGIGSGGGESDSLLTALVAYWDLDEAAGTRVDSIGSNDLSDTSATAQGAAIAAQLNNSADFELSSSNFLAAPSNSVLQRGDIDWSLAFWVNIESLPGLGTATLVAKSADSALNQEFDVRYRKTPDRIEFVVRNGAAVAIGVASADVLGSPSIGTPYFFVVYHDAANNEVGIGVNNGVFNTAATTGTAGTNNERWSVGALVGGAGEVAYFDGLESTMWLWNRMLTAEEITRLYNGGNGLTLGSL